MAPETRAKIIFFGSPEFAAVSLRALLADSRFQVALVVTNPDRPAGRGKKELSTPVKTVATSASIPCLTPNKISADIDGFINEASAYGPFDIGVVVAFGQLLPPAVLSLPKTGCLNIHGSLLPRWRGAAPMQRAIMSGDMTTGVQLMQMEAGLDTGPVFATTTGHIDDTTTLALLHDTLALEGSLLLTRHLPQILDGTLSAVQQSTEGVTYAKKISNQEAQLEWKQSSHALVRHIHGLSPHPGAFSLFQGKRIKVFQAATREKLPHEASMDPGTVLFASGDELRVATGDGCLSLLELQIEGKKRLPTREFLSGVEIKPGDKFGA